MSGDYTFEVVMQVKGLKYGHATSSASITFSTRGASGEGVQERCCLHHGALELFLLRCAFG